MAKVYSTSSAVNSYTGKVTYENISSNKAIVNMFASAQRAKWSGNAEMLSYLLYFEPF